jgi:hypothetical protein
MWAKIKVKLPETYIGKVMAIFLKKLRTLSRRPSGKSSKVAHAVPPLASGQWCAGPYLLQETEDGGFIQASHRVLRDGVTMKKAMV